MTNTLPIKAKVMIGMVAVASLCALSFGVVRWQSQAWPQLLAPASGSRAEFAPQGEVAWDDELDVGKSARHSSGSYATGIVRQPARRGDGSDRAILHVRREQNETNPICLQRMHTAERVRPRLPGLPQPDVRGPRGSAHHVPGTGRRHLLRGEHGAGSEHHRPDRRRQSFCPLAQGLPVVVPELRNRCGIDCDRLGLHHRQRPGWQRWQL
jgi:hypothetical protein